ncbi:MAG: SurA N-terminal domain-containing protein [Desulfobacula sp.]|nr:SurA N-terminal domain-containing protein [Desulfobacula sp.]
MKNKIRLGVIFWIISITLSLCMPLSAHVIDKIVAIVDSDIITLVELNKESAPYLQKLEAAGYPDEKKKQMKKQIQDKILSLLIDRSLTQQEAKKYNIIVSDAEVDNSLETLKKMKSLTQEEFEMALIKDGMTLEKFRENSKKQMLQTKLINHSVKSKVVITEVEIKAYYDANTKKYAGIKKYHLKNILLSDEEKARAVYKKLTHKKRFTTLAKKYSKAPNATDGGNLGIFDINNFSASIKQRIGTLKKGEFTTVMKTTQGYQIFYVEDIVLDGNKTLEQANDEIYELLYRQQVEKKFKTWLESLKKQANIELKF